MITSILKNIIILIISSGVLGWQVEISIKTSNALNILNLILITISGVLFTLSIIRLKNKIAQKYNAHDS